MKQLHNEPICGGRPLFHNHPESLAKMDQQLQPNPKPDDFGTMVFLEEAFAVS